MTNSVLNYPAAFAAGPAQVGGKGWNLARLARYGFLVPAGGVLIADGYVRVLAADHFRNRLERLAGCTAQDASDPQVAAVLNQFASAIRGETLPSDVVDDIQRFLTEHRLAAKPLAVRSSACSEDGAETSFAGIHESWLNVVGAEEVCQAVLNCYASLWTPQALAYRRRMNVADGDAACAVVLCEMIAGPEGPPVAAGVAFSCHPLSGRRDVITVNCAAGLGDAVVRGDVTPDEYVLNAHDTTTIESRVERGSPLLEDSDITALGRLVWCVHWALGEGQDPQDIEWAFDGQQFWLLQSRPVTRLPRCTLPPLAGQPPIWSNANIKDSFLGPATMVTWSMMEAVVRDVLFASLKLVGYPLPAGMQVLRRFAGRFYFDLAIVQWSMYDAIGITPAETNRTTGGFQPEIRVPAGNPLRGGVGLRRSWRRLRMLWGLARFRRRLPAAIENVFRENRRAREMNLGSLSDEQLLAEFRRRVAVGNAFTPDIQLAAAYYGAWMTLLQDFLGRLTGDRQQSLVTRLLAASGSVASAEHGYRLVDLAKLARNEPRAQAALDSADSHNWQTLDRQLSVPTGFRTLSRRVWTSGRLRDGFRVAAMARRSDLSVTAGSWVLGNVAELRSTRTRRENPSRGGKRIASAQLSCSTIGPLDVVQDTHGRRVARKREECRRRQRRTNSARVVGSRQADGSARARPRGSRRIPPIKSGRGSIPLWRLVRGRCQAHH